jgi:hypothetical protein
MAQLFSDPTSEDPANGKNRPEQKRVHFFRFSNNSCRNWQP